MRRPSLALKRAQEGVLLTADERRIRTLRYLQTASKATREAFQLNRFDKAAKLRKELRQIIEEYVEAEVEARLAARVREFAELGGCILPSCSHDPRQKSFSFNGRGVTVLPARNRGLVNAKLSSQLGLRESPRLTVGKNGRRKVSV